MEKKCSVCTTPQHTEKFGKILAALREELKKRDIRGIEDPDELAMALAVLAADAAGIDVYV